MRDTLERQEKEILDCLMEFDRSYEVYARHTGLTYMSLSVLEMIYRNNGRCTQKSVSEGLRYPKQSVNLIVKGWIKDGYISLETVDTDRRNKVLSLTETGMAYAKRVIGTLDGADERAFQRLSEEDREAFVRCLRIYTNGFTEETGKLF